jgi:hypothetical protein
MALFAAGRSMRSGAGLVLDRWFSSLGAKLTGELTSSNLLALIGRT